jgi:hypothetical protein
MKGMCEASKQKLEGLKLTRHWLHFLGYSDIFLVEVRMYSQVIPAATKTVLLAWIYCSMTAQMSTPINQV